MHLKDEFTTYRLPESEDWSLYNVVTGDMYQVNQIIIDVLELLNADQDPEAIASELGTRYSESPEVARQVVSETISQLRDIGALTDPGAPGDET